MIASRLCSEPRHTAANAACASQAHRRSLSLFMDTTPHTLLHRLRHAAPQPNSADWNRFVEIVAPSLYEWAQRFTNPWVDAADLVQEVFVVLLRKLPEFEVDRRKSFRGW